MNTVYLGIGSNLGQRELFLKHARQLLSEQAGSLLHVSSVYETEAWSMIEACAFLNQVVMLHTSLSPEELLRTCLRIEKRLGRKRADKTADVFMSRTCDIDILLFGDQVIAQPDLQIPHPGIAERKFVLVPLVEIVGAEKHPQTGHTFIHQLATCQDQTEVRKWDSPTAI